MQGKFCDETCLTVSVRHDAQVLNYLQEPEERKRSGAFLYAGVCQRTPACVCACACACARVLKPLVYFVFSWREHVWRERPPFFSVPHWQSFQSSRHRGIERTTSPLTLRVERKGHVAPWWPEGHERYKIHSTSTSPPVLYHILSHIHNFQLAVH